MAGALNELMKIEVPVIVQVAERSMPLQDVLALGPGTIIDLPKSVDEPLEILVNNKPVGRGRAVRVGENYGVQVQQIGGLDSRIRAMGQNGGRAEVEQPKAGAPEPGAAVEQAETAAA